MNYQLHLGDSLEILKSLPENSVDSLITDPPAGIGLMGLEWDKNKGGRDEWIRWLSQVMTECFRVMKPGSHGFVWAIPRTSHWTGMALENAGFQVKDVVTHIFGSGFPKSTAIDKAIDRAKYTDTALLFEFCAWMRKRRNELGLTNAMIDEIADIKGGACHWTANPPSGQPHIPTKERWDKLEPVFGPAPGWVTALIRPAHEPGGNWKGHRAVGPLENERRDMMGEVLHGSANARSLEWKGWGTALKPASENWILVQKPISEHNLAANVLKHRTGAINIDASRIHVHGKIPSTTNLDFRDGGFLWDTSERSRSSVYTQHPQGRFPANLVITPSHEIDCPARALNNQNESGTDVAPYFKNLKPEDPFFYCKKAGKSERGLDNNHPTVKPLRLMSYLVKMITPSGGVVLDPFAGSGSTGVAALSENFGFIGVERDPNYYQIAEKRLKGSP